MRINSRLLAPMRSLLAFVLLLSLNEILAQPCDPKWNRIKSSNCENSPIQFEANSPGRTTYEWDFGDGFSIGPGSTSAYRDPVHAYSKEGVYTVTFKGSGGVGSCSDTVMVTIKASPIIKPIALFPRSQCFSGQKFCFIDSTKAARGSKLQTVKYLFGDGKSYTLNNPKGGDTICHSFTKPEGGLYGLTIEAEDINGCISKVYYDKYLKVLPKLTVSFSSTKPDSCIYSTVLLKNLTDTFTKLRDIAKFEWNFGDPSSANNVITGDSITNSSLYANVKHRYEAVGKPTGKYQFNAKLTITTKYGCTDSFSMKPAGFVNSVNAKIIANNTTSCVGSEPVKFTAIDTKSGNPITGVNSFNWNFGDPKTGTDNFNKNLLADVPHNFSEGSWMISLNLKLGLCNVTLFDTIIRLGPNTKIEIPNNRVSENEKYQSTIRDSVHFTNNSLFYHNDGNQNFEDSMINGNYVFKWPGDQSAIPSKLTKQRNNDNVLRLWDFGDSYAPKCTTDTKKNKNVGLNCNWSMDSLPVHWYTPWDQIYKNHYYSLPAEKTVLCKGGKYCFKVNYYRQQSLNIPADTLVIVSKDSTFKYAGRTITPATKEITAGTFRVKKVPSKFKGQATYTPTLSDETWVFYTTGAIRIKNILTGNQYTKGTGAVTLKKGDQFELKKGDSAILRSQVWITASKTITAQPATVCIDTVIGARDTFIQRSRIYIDSNFHRTSFYLKNSQCYNVKLFQQDTVNTMRCKTSNTIALALVAPNADGLTFGGIQCFAPPSQYGMTFSVANTKPGVTQRLLKFNFDSASGKNNWVTQNGLVSPPLPGSSPWSLGYSISGAYPNTFVKPYGAGDIQMRNPGWVTVGLIIGNGKIVNGVPENMDTTWYHNAFRYNFLDAQFDIIQPERDKKTVCVGDTFSFKLFDPKMDSITSLAWTWNDDEGSYYEERTFYYKPYPGPNANRNDKTINDWKKGDKWLYNYVIRLEFDGFNFKTLDTIVTGIMRKWSMAVNVSKSGSALQNAFKSIGLNVREIPTNEIGMYLGNGKNGGCIDTTGFGNTIKFGIAPFRDALTYKNGTSWYRYTDYSKTKSTLVSQKLHWRDSSQAGWDTLKQAKANKYTGLTATPGVYRHAYKKSGRYFPTVQLRNTEGCFQPRNKEVDVGFYWNWSFSDTTTCGNGLIVIKDSIRYFAYEDPFAWLNPTAYWRNSSRYIKQFETKKVDFNEHDDTISSNRFNVTGLGVPPFAWQYTKPGIYTIRIAMKDSLGCKDTARQKIYVTGAKAGFKFDNGSNPCLNIISFTDTSRIIDPCAIKGKPCNEIVEYTWDFGDGTQRSKLANPSHKYTKYGTFTVSLVIKTKLGCGDSIAQKVIIAGPQPIFKLASDSVVCVGDSVTFSNQSKDPLYNPSWEWNFGDGRVLTNNGTRKSVKHSYTAPGLYEVYLTMFDNIQGTSQRCSSTYPDTANINRLKITVRVMICGKISNSAKTNLSIYPNPAYDHIFIKGLTKGELIIFDISGKEVLRNYIDTSQSIDVSILKKGTYFIRCTDGSMSWNGRFVKVM